jgi:hypothetical protein
VKTTLELPDTLLRQAQEVASRNGLLLGAFVADAIQSRLSAVVDTPTQPWMKHFGSLRHLHAESARIAKIIRDEFESIDPHDWR